jgi:hypothetical protein
LAAPQATAAISVFEALELSHPGDEVFGARQATLAEYMCVVEKE